MKPLSPSSPAPRPLSGNSGNSWRLMPDAALASAAAVPDQAGREAFVEIVRRHQSAVCAVAWSVAGGSGLTDDIAQETFFKAWKQIATLRDPSKLKAWLTRIAHDCAVDALRKERPHTPLEDPAAPWLPAARCPAASPDNAAVEAEEEALVWSALAALPENLRTPLVLFYREGKSMAAVAAALDLSEEAVRQRLSRGRQALRSVVEQRVENVLGRVRPPALLTVTIAAGIGLLPGPPAAAAVGMGSGAATAAGGAAAGGALGISSFMTATSWLAAAITLAAFLPLGWNARIAASASGKSSPGLPLQTAPDDPFAVWPRSKLLTAWRQLHAEHGSDAAAMPVIYGLVQTEPDAFRQDSLNTALLAEWAAVDPESAFQTLWSENKHTDHAAQLMRVWLKRVPDQAAGHLLAHFSGAEALVTAIAGDIAVLAPGHFIAVLSALPEPAEDPHQGRRVPQEIVEAFSEFARRDLSAAVDALPLLKGLLLDSARISVARRMAEKDPVSAMAWAQALDPKGGGEKSVQAVMDVWARADPAAALGSLDTSNSSKSLAGRVLGIVAEKDLAGAMKLLSENREKFEGTADMIISSRLNRQFGGNPMAMLQLLEGQPENLRKHLVEASGMEADSRYGRLSPEAAGEVWDWIRKHPPEGLADGIGNGMLLAEMRADPQAAIRRLASLPENWQVPLCTTNPAGFVPNIRMMRDSLSRSEFEQMLGSVAPAARSPLLATFFGKSDPGAMPEPELWRQRLDELPPDLRQQAAANYTGSLTDTDPQLAMAFAGSLPPGPVQESAYRQMAGWWAGTDAHAASAWLDTLPPGSGRDAAAAGLVESLPFSDADAAFTWAATITDNEQRLKCLTGFMQHAAWTDPDRVPALLGNPLLSPADSEALHQKLKPANPAP